MKLPFLEQSVLSIFLDDGILRWVELSKLGKRLKLRSHGEYSIQSTQDLSTALSEIKKQITADGFLMAFSSPQLLKELIIEEIPFFESFDDTMGWVRIRQEQIVKEFDANVQIQHHVIDVGEDHKRCLFQIVDKQSLLTYSKIFRQQELFPALITSGIIETGYSQIYEDYFVKGLSGVLVSSSKKKVLCYYLNGLFHSLFEFDESQKTDLIENTNSYLQSEELAIEHKQGSSVLIGFHSSEEGFNHEVNRVQKKLLPFPSNSAFEVLTEQYAGACGSAIKIYFPALDPINFSDSETVAVGVDFQDKKEFVRATSLLLSPMMIIFLLIFAIDSMLDYRLIETDQIMKGIGDKIALVDEKENQLNESISQLNALIKLINQRENTIIVFNMINKAIPEEVWLNKLEVDNMSGKHVAITINGYTLRERLISDFMGRLEENEKVNQVVLSGIHQVPKERFEAFNAVSIPVVGFEIKIKLDK